MAWQALGAVRQRLLLEAVQPQAGRVERACSPGVGLQGPDARGDPGAGSFSFRQSSWQGTAAEW